MSLVDQHHDDVGIAPACNALNVSRATSLTNAARPFNPQRISCVDLQYIFEILCGEQFLDMTPRGAHAALLSQGTYLCSVRIMYRILDQKKAIRERRRIASHPQAEVPRLRATRPN